MKLDKVPFPMHTIDLNNAKVLIRPDQTEGAKGKNVIIGDERPLIINNKILAWEVVQEKAPDEKKNLTIIVKPRGPGVQEGSSSGAGLLPSRDRSDRLLRLVRPVLLAGQTTLAVNPICLSLNVRKWVQGRQTSQRCKVSSRIRSPPLVSC